jgi:hypothetical protein
VFEMGPAAALETVGDGEYPEDLSRQDRVFLLGEGRFENRQRTDSMCEQGMTEKSL